MSRVLFVDTGAQAAWIASQLPVSERGLVVAVTAAAAEALAAREIAHLPASEVCDLRALAHEEYPINVAVARLAGAAEAFIADRHPRLLDELAVELDEALFQPLQQRLRALHEARPGLLHRHP